MQGLCGLVSDAAVFRQNSSPRGFVELVVLNLIVLMGVRGNQPSDQIRTGAFGPIGKVFDEKTSFSSEGTSVLILGSGSV